MDSNNKGLIGRIRSLGWGFAAMLFIAGIVPGVMMGLAIMLAWHWCTKHDDMKVEPKFTLRQRLKETRDAAWALVLPVVIIFALGQALETYVLTPYLVGERIGLHPLAVIFVLMAFAHWFGFVGMLIALPTGAVLLVVLRDLLAAWKRSTLYRGRRGKGP